MHREEIRGVLVSFVWSRIWIFYCAAELTSEPAALGGYLRRGTLGMSTARCACSKSTGRNNTKTMNYDWWSQFYRLITNARLQTLIKLVNLGIEMSSKDWAGGDFSEQPPMFHTLKGIDSFSYVLSGLFPNRLFVRFFQTIRIPSCTWYVHSIWIIDTGATFPINRAVIPHADSS